MESYEINILKRNGDWKKYNQKDISTSSKNNVDHEQLFHKVEIDENENHYINFLSYINEVNVIVNKLENLENEKNNLKNELKKYEKFFQSRKKISEQNLSRISKEVEMFDKAIGVIKNLKDF